MLAQKRPWGPASRQWDPATGEYEYEELPVEVQEMLGIKKAKIEKRIVKEEKAWGEVKAEATAAPSTSSGKHRGPAVDEIDKKAPSVELKGFSKVELNNRYWEHTKINVNGKTTYWSTDTEFFIYWQSKARRWAICDAASLFAVKAGQYPGWAFKSSDQPLHQAAGWMEAWDGEWSEASLEIIFRSPSESKPQWSETDDKSVSSVEYRGFVMKELNTKYFLRANEQVQGKETYWDKSGVYFMYWQEAMKRWALCDLKCYQAVKEGQCPGWAYRKDSDHFANACGWMERRGDEWGLAKVETAVITVSAKRLTVSLKGFKKKQLNVVYKEKPSEEVQGRSTYWDPTGNYFIYWQKTASRWAICDKGSFVLAQQGLTPGWAYKNDSAHFTRSRQWKEACPSGEWKAAVVSCKVLDGNVRDDGYTLNAVKAEDHEDAEEPDLTVAQYRTAIRKVYEKRNPSKLEDLDQILAKHAGREHALYRDICAKYNINPGDFAARKPVGPPVESDNSDVPHMSAQEAAVLVQNIYMIHNPKKIRDIGAILLAYKDKEVSLYEEVCKKYGENPLQFHARHASTVRSLAAVKAEL